LAELRCDKPWSRIKQDLEELQIFYLGYPLNSTNHYMLCFGLWPPRVLDEI
jgi:hypothetical protein